MQKQIGSEMEDSVKVEINNQRDYIEVPLIPCRNKSTI